MKSIRKFLESTSFYRVPLKDLPTGHYQFRAKVNGITGHFILDTGASTSCIGFDSIQHFKLNSESSEIKAAGAGAVNMHTMMARNNTFGIKNWVVKNMDFVLFDLSHVNHALLETEGNAVHGIIGADFLKARRAVIDYGRNCFYIK